jgi:hypothetical protein
VNVLREEKRQQVLALGKLHWSLHEIQKATGVRRETISKYLRAAGIPVRAPRTRRPPEPNPASGEGVSTDSGSPNPASGEGVSTDCAPQQWRPPSRAPAASACEPYRDFIEHALARGRNAVAIYQDLVDDHGFTAKYSSVKRFVQ